MRVLKMTQTVGVIVNLLVKAIALRGMYESRKAGGAIDSNLSVLYTLAYLKLDMSAEHLILLTRKKD